VKSRFTQVAVAIASPGAGSVAAFRWRAGWREKVVVVLDLIADSGPWLYLALAGLAVLDAFVFLVPSELLVLSAGSFAAAGQADPVTVVLRDRPDRRGAARPVPALGAAIEHRLRTCR
jgi:hypothetical protein